MIAVKFNDVVDARFTLGVKPNVAPQPLYELVSRVHFCSMVAVIVALQHDNLLNVLTLLTKGRALNKLYIRYAPLRSYL